MNFYSQHGEDQLLAKIFSKTDGVCVEVGANDGVTFSTSLCFEEMGWQCILVEPTPSLCALIRERREALLFECAASASSGRTLLRIAEGHSLYSSLEKDSTMERTMSKLNKGFQEISVSTRTLDEILLEARVVNIDFISIDVEGHELSALKGLTISRWQPKIMIIEDATDLQETAVSRYMRLNGYTRFYRTGGNDWYARKGSVSVTNVIRLAFNGSIHLSGLLKANLPVWLRKPLLLTVRSIRGQ